MWHERMTESLPEHLAGMPLKPPRLLQFMIELRPVSDSCKDGVSLQGAG